MIKNINVTCIACQLDLATKKHINEKFGMLNRYLPRHAGKSVSIGVKLMDASKKQKHDDEKYMTEVNLYLPKKTINAKGLGATLIMAIDAAAAKAQAQLADYKQKSVNHLGYRGILSKFKRGFSREL